MSFFSLAACDIVYGPRRGRGRKQDMEILVLRRVSELGGWVVVVGHMACAWRGRSDVDTEGRWIFVEGYLNCG